MICEIFQFSSAMASTQLFYSFLANMNSSSCSLYVIGRPSVCRLSSVTLVHSTQAIEIVGNISTPFGTLTIRNNFTEIVPGEPHVGVKTKRGSQI